MAARAPRRERTGPARRRAGEVYIANQGITDGSVVHPGGLWVINGRTNKVTAAITAPAGAHPLAVAVSPRTGDAYVGNGYQNNQTVWVLSD